jgi:lipoprotein NlpI
MAYKGRGNACYAKADYDRAVADYNEAITFDPKYAIAYNSRGNAYYAKADYDRAIADHTEAIRLDQKYAIAYNSRGNAYYANADYDRAIADYSEVIGLDPKYAVAYNSRGNAYHAKGAYDRAIADYDEAVELDPKYAMAYNGRGNTYKDKGDLDRAISDYSYAIENDPKNSIPYGNRGKANFYKGAFAAAAVDLLRSSELKADGYTMLWRYLARNRSGEKAEGELQANAALLNAKDWPYAVIDFYLGRSSMNEMLSAAAKPDEQCQVQFYLGEWHLLQDKREDAETALRAAVDACPKSLAEYAAAVAELNLLRP